MFGNGSKDEDNQAAEAKRPEWQAYCEGNQIKPGDWLHYQVPGTHGRSHGRRIKFVAVSPDGLSLLGDYNTNPVTLPVGGFHGVSVKRPAGTIDLTPTWVAVLPILIESLSNDNTRASAKLELIRMAQAADAYNASVKK